MKKKLIIFSAIFLISISVTGRTFSWFASGTGPYMQDSEMGTVKVDVIERGLDDIKIKNSGTSEIYIRARLIPQWSDQSLSLSNVELKLANGWIEKDGYYYYKYPVKKNGETTNLIKSVIYKDLTPEYENARFTLKVVAEGVQSAHGAWKDTWNINSLPF